MMMLSNYQQLSWYQYNPSIIEIESVSIGMIALNTTSVLHLLPEVNHGWIQRRMYLCGCTSWYSLARGIRIVHPLKP